MRKRKNIAVFIGLLCITISAMGQQDTTSYSPALSGNLERRGDLLYVDLRVDLTQFELDRNRSLTLTPVLMSGGMKQELQKILINGTTRQKAYERDLALENVEPVPYREIIKLSDSNKKEFLYTETVPFANWMSDVFLDVNELYCGCGGHEEATNTVPVAKYLQPMPPLVVYTQPEVETIKTRTDSWDAFLDFPVNRTEIRPDYMSNPAELSKIETALREIESDKNLTVNRIYMIGYASPEGGIAHNENLSKGRAESFRSYLQSRANFPSNIYEVEYGGENWQGLEKALEESTLDSKNQLLEIIQSSTDANYRKDAIKRFRNGAPYRQILTEIYPKLRKVIVKVEYMVRAFTVEESKALFRTRPRQLSQEEMFRLADTYEPGSREFVEVFDVAVKMFPDNKVANLNAAAAALSAKDYVKAQQYLLKADTTTPEYMNNMGVYYWNQGQTERAKILFQEAARKGVGAAQQNLQRINR
ncbi:MAG: DUF3868 domain-containing protein [Bacteroides sp.]|nr:DUF3868 domain-containing protein [Bacteroides sp.]